MYRLLFAILLLPLTAFADEKNKAVLKPAQAKPAATAKSHKNYFAEYDKISSCDQTSEQQMAAELAQKDARILELENALRIVAADLQASSATNQALVNRPGQSPVVIRQIDPALYRTTFHSEPDPLHCSAFTWGSNTSVNCR